VINLKLQISS
jgi:hypothetical protein